MLFILSLFLDKYFDQCKLYIKNNTYNDLKMKDNHNDQSDHIYDKERHFIDCTLFETKKDIFKFKLNQNERKFSITDNNKIDTANDDGAPSEQTCSTKCTLFQTKKDMFIVKLKQNDQNVPITDNNNNNIGTVDNKTALGETRCLTKCTIFQTKKDMFILESNGKLAAYSFKSN
ncbi:putative Bracovirus protein MdBV-20 [Microplitis demolitor]